MSVVKEDKLSDSLISLELLIPAFCLLNLILGIVIYFTNDLLFEWYIQEDGYVESLTAIFLLFTAIISGIKVKSTANKGLKALYFLIAIVFVFGAGEEISWGQRFIGFSTPDKLEAINTQKDFTLHNIEVNDVRLNKVIFGLGLYTAMFIYFLVLPFIGKKTKFRRFLDKLKLPVPTKTLGLIYVLCFFSLLVINHGKVWELQELAFTSFIFMTFLYYESRNQQSVS